MLVPVKWIRDYVNIDMDTVEFADKMTMTGTKVETVEFLGKEISNVVVGQIKEITQHPNADKLVVCQVNVGEEELVQICTGAKNVLEGDFVPVAKVNSTLPGGIKIKKGKLRGEASHGMLCGAEELGIDENLVNERSKDGIYILNDMENLVIGQDIKEFLGLNDAIIDFELTANRPDCRSMIGIAREAAITIGQKIKYPEIEVKACDEDIDFEVKIENPKLCPRYGARIVKDVKIEPSPYWMQRRLIEAGVRPINNIVDITNFVMLEQGQPLHAFDLNELPNGKIVVRNAVEGEKFTTLDEVERTLDKDMLVITDGEKPVAIAGVMGGLNSGITDNTTAVLFEGAAFNADSIRLTSKKLGLRTESSGRYEKGVCTELSITGVERACQLVEMLGAGRVLRGTVEDYPAKQEAQSLTVNPSRIIKNIGIDLSLDGFVKILKDLEFKCDLKSDDEVVIEVPPFRLDIEQEADIYEEIARIYGFENIPSEQLEGNATAGVKTPQQKFMDKIKDTATSIGLYEILTYSFVSPKSLDKIKLPEDDKKRDYITLINPLGEDTSVMRTTMMPSMLNVLYTNVSRKVESGLAFECGHTFTPQEGLPIETNHLCVGMYGKDVDFFVLKGALETILDSVGFENYEIIPETNNTTFHPGRCATIMYNNIYIGTFGEVHPEVIDNYNLGQRVYLAELDLDLIFENSDRTIIYNPLPKYPSTSRDIALLVKDDVIVKQIEDIIKANGEDLLESYKLFDVYKGSQIADGYKSIAYSIIYRSKDKTLTDEDVNKVHQNIIRELEEKLDAKLRSN
ncbi:MAG: phenylalanine--tRNA ligase subunit beta [Terrisporobacter othiniensis]|uniref:phenylalanine--tRNA ligase subunit beta n=1 Tax=Terrisporobacter petrolearius TaxID=1460447 RepID=UPI0022DF2F94|nr:phenylalanine--tRNA ligase subunit beta [Terrisporobacter petrolearius]MDU4861912.1 phenylalanine--tRNA ligase subunit beta [Terrisporobacter othiniensis]MDU6995791.1 phenylalanine--tRNA ligase subunit beta [Terrisporobacter othiniensis]